MQPAASRLIPSLFFLIFHFAKVLSAAAEPPTITIGVIAPYTLGSAAAGKEILRVTEIFTAQEASRVNYKFIFEDGKCGVGSGAATAAQKLINRDKVAALLVACSGEVLQAGPIAERAHVPMFAVFGSHKDIKTLGSYVYRTFVDLEGGAKLLAHALESDGRSRIVVLSESNPFTQGLRGLLEQSLAGRIVSADDFDANETDFRTLLAKTKSKNPDAVYLNCASAKTLLPLVRQLHEQGIEVPIYSYLYPGEREFLENADGLGEGIKFLTLPDPDPTNEIMRRFLQAYSAKYSETPSYQFLIAATEDALLALHAAFLAVGTNSDKVRQFLDAYHGAGALGPTEFDANGDLLGVHFVMKRISQGKPVMLSAAGKPG